MSPVGTVCPVLATPNVEVGTSHTCHKKFNIGIDATPTLQSLEARTDPTSNRKIPVTDLETLYEKCYCEFVSISVPNSTRFSVVQLVRSARK